ncbi:DUF927 domain-containing protein [uncultured Acinetobacter sp.]|uniref:DUF927 domain-containing protein n=1 Tax=Acinetobacter soli TaxID=487316 RepID=UPI00258B09CF|nr:DUF927 domain-containing protein [uncultured Acinetobacter sp.]
MKTSERDGFFELIEKYEPLEYDNGYFEVTEAGLFYVKKNKDAEHKKFISSPILVLAKTRDDRSVAWGRLLKWIDDSGVIHTLAISMQNFQTDGAELRKMLSDQGVTIGIGVNERKLFLTYLANYPIKKFALCVNKVGWHADQYILPNNVIGSNQSNEIVVYQTNDPLQDKYKQKGTLAEWQENISKKAEAHKFLVLAICVAFAGSLLSPLKQNGTIIHNKSKSSKGKTTSLYVSASVWGNPVDYYQTWRSTSNALEQAAFSHNDGVLILDEISEISNPSELGNIVYMLINGSGKGRLTKSISLRDINKWQLMVLSSGEKSLSELMQEVGQKTKLGQEIRLINIDLDSSPYGIFDSVDFEDNAALQAILLNKNLKLYYGTAGIEWLNYLTSDFKKRSSEAQILFDEYSKLLISDYKEGHIIRVANSFALIAVAGELATQANITSWQSGTAIHAIKNVFKEWYDNFDHKSGYEDKEILEHIKSFFSIHGSSRFESLEQVFCNPITGNQINIKTMNRVGYWKDSDDGKLYLVYPELFKKDICIGLNHKQVSKLLRDYGWLDHDDGRTTKSIRLPHLSGTTRMMIFKESEMYKFSID